MLKILDQKLRLGSVLIAVLSGLLIVGVLSQTPMVSQRLNEAFLNPQSESITELYFTKHVSLPKEYSTGSQEVIEFTLSNQSNEKKTYKYEILQVAESGSPVVVLASGAVELSSWQSQNQKAPVVFSDSTNNARIIVNLPELSRSIHFWTRQVNV